MIKQQAYKMLIDEKNHRTQAYEKFKYEGIKENMKNVKHENLNKENDQTTSL